MTIAGLICDARFFRAFNVFAALWWAGMLAHSLHRRRFSFGQVQFLFRKIGPPLGIALATKPTAYRVCIGIYAGIILILVIEAFVWPWPLPLAATMASFSCR